GDQDENRGRNNGDREDTASWPVRGVANTKLEGRRRAVTCHRPPRRLVKAEGNRAHAGDEQRGAGTEESSRRIKPPSANKKNQYSAHDAGGGTARRQASAGPSRPAGTHTVARDGAGEQAALGRAS